MVEKDANTQGRNPSGSEQATTGEAGVTDRLRQKATDVKDKIKDKAGEYTREAREKVKSAADQQKGRLADELHTVADAFRGASQKLHEGQEERLAPYADKAADYFEHTSAYFRDQGLSDLLDDARAVARRHPALFIGGALLLGFALGRFIKSSSNEEDAMGDYEYDHAQDPGQDFSATEPQGMNGLDASPGTSGAGPGSLPY